MARIESVSRGRWVTPEFLFYYIYAVGFYTLFIQRALNLSAEYSRLQLIETLPRLTPGWIPALPFVDLSDSQWRNFREGLALLTPVMALLTFLSQAIRHACGRKGVGDAGGCLTLYWVVASLAYVSYLHGACVLIMVTIAGMNFAAVQALKGRRALPWVVWGFNCGVLVLNRVFDGYRFQWLGQRFAFLDEYRGVFRWHICFNLVILRMVSFGLDTHWKYSRPPPPSLSEKHQRECDVCVKGGVCYTARQPVPFITSEPKMRWVGSFQERGVSQGQYSWPAYLAYLFFPPLYLAGPIITFNAFASQLFSPQQSHSWRAVVGYGLRWLACLFLLDLLTHAFCFQAMASSGVWHRLAPIDVCVIGYGVLNVMWLKFLVMWRFFRFWALVCGVESPENMLRCVNNSFDIEGFWRGWHASYNRWLVRYLYIPLGGSTWRSLNTWPVFTFVALWHDLEWKMVGWAWLTCLLALPEMVAKMALKTKVARSWEETWAYREVCAVGGAFSIAGLMVANLAGFVVGLSGIQTFCAKLLVRENFGLCLYIFFSLYVGTKFMLEIRAGERRKKESKEQTSLILPALGVSSNNIPLRHLEVSKRD